jgi:uncharacterized protein YndB with AHSA1/START domain
MWAIEYAGTTSASNDRVHAILADVDRWHEWNPGVRRAELHGPFAAGTPALMVLPDGEELPFLIASVEPNHGYVDETPVPDADVLVRVHHRLEPLEAGGTRIVYRCEIEGPGAEELGPIVGPQVSGDFPEVIASLAERAESG